jgi:FkbM family methyltransferase
MRIKSFSYEMDTDDLSINEVARLHQTFFVDKKYDWWYEVLPDDIVVDIGAGTGMFSAKALDAGAEKVYMIEPNKQLLKTAIKNVGEYFMDTESPRVVPINAAIGKSDIDLSNVYKSKNSDDEEPKLMSLRELVDKYDLKHIDFLKIDAEGAELNFLVEHTDYLSSHVRHSAINVHIDAQYGAYERYIEFRHKILKPFNDSNRLRFQDESLREKMLSDTPLKLLPKEFMVYITNY